MAIEILKKPEQPPWHYGKCKFCLTEFRANGDDVMESFLVRTDSGLCAKCPSCGRQGAVDLEPAPQ